MNDIIGKDAREVGAAAKIDDITEVSRVLIEVNGATIEVTKSVSVHEILTKTKNAGAIEGVIEEYIIERLERKGEIKLQETITVAEGERFFAIPTRKAKVAKPFDAGRSKNHMNVDLQIANELKELGYHPEFIEGDTAGGRQKIVVFSYQIPVGRFRGETRNIGVSTQCEAMGYPETPPHWIFVNPPLRETRDGGNHGINSIDGRDWIALSRPPGQFWDRVQHKGMKAYLEHLSKVWAVI